MRKTYPSEEQDRFMLRLPEGMRARIKDEADAKNRTMNAEIIARLEESFEIEPDVRGLLKAHEKSIDELNIESGDYAKRILALQTQFEELSDAFSELTVSIKSA